MYLYEISTCKFILKYESSTPILLLKKSVTGGLNFINKNGKVFTLDIFEAKLIPLIGFKLAETHNLNVTDKMRADEFKSCLVKNDIKTAAYIAAKTPFLRDENVLRSVETSENKLLNYLTELKSLDTLKEIEKVKYFELLKLKKEEE